ncbi:MAG: penicillin-binding protein 2 [Lachnospiraceae bacterium]|nr:penicillin-binding protein 2 [Lachnospiraceae bacterium]
MSGTGNQTRGGGNGQDGSNRRSRTNRQGGRRGSNRQKKADPTKFRPYMRGKLVFFCGLCLIAVGFLVWRLVNITATSEEKYKQIVLSQQAYDSTSLPYKRGSILDANGTILAYSEKVYNVILDTKAMLADEDAYTPTLEALEVCFEDVDISAVKEYVSEYPSSQYRIVCKSISYDEMQAYYDYVDQVYAAGEAAAEAKGESYGGTHITGIWFEEQYERKYPYSTLASEVLGFTGSDNNGMFGLEEYYNDILNGTAGREYGYLNEDSEVNVTTIPASDGYSIVTTIDANIQTIVEKWIDYYNEELRDNYREGAGAENIGVIVMDVNDGSVLAMASNTGYDCNDPYDLSEYFTDAEWAALQEDSDAFYTESNQIWRNFCISDTYEPGSVAKPFTVAMALETGTITGNETYQCNGYLEVGGWTISCHNTSGHGTVTVSEAIEESCNVAMMYISQAVGSDTFAEFQNRFGFGLKSNIDLAGEARTASLIYTADTMGSAELATSSFGQGFQVSMIQMAASFCSLVNGGYLYEPRVVSQIVSSNGTVVENISAKLVKRTISESTSEKIIEYCNNVITEGTGTRAAVAGYLIGGKTGTSETLPRGNGDYVISFCGYAPADDPQVLVYVVIDRPNVDDQGNSTKYACWLSKDIMTDILPYLGIFMTEELTEEEEEELAERSEAVIQGYLEKRALEDTEEDIQESADNSDLLDETAADNEATTTTIGSTVADIVESTTTETGESGTEGTETGETAEE